MPRRFRLTTVFAISTSVLMLAACGTGSSSSDSDATTITVYTSEPEDKMNELVAAFNEEEPDIEVKVFRGGTGDLTTRIATEQKSGEIKADVLLAADAATFETYKADEELVEYSPEGADELIDGVVDPDGYYTGTRVIPTVVAYNTTAIDSPPGSWQDLTDPQYQDKIVMPNPDVSGAAAYNAAVWLDDPGLGLPWLEALAANNPVVADSNGPVSQAVATGAQPIGIVVDYLVRDLAADGSPIDVSYPSEGVPFVSQPAGIFADSANQDAAKAFVDFLVSKEGQELAVTQNYLPVRDDVGSPEGAPEMSELTLMSPDLQQILDTKEDAVKTFNELVQK